MKFKLFLLATLALSIMNSLDALTFTDKDLANLAKLTNGTIKDCFIKAKESNEIRQELVECVILEDKLSKPDAEAYIDRCIHLYEQIDLLKFQCDVMNRVQAVYPELLPREFTPADYLKYGAQMRAAIELISDPETKENNEEYLSDHKSRLEVQRDQLEAKFYLQIASRKECIDLNITESENDLYACYRIMREQDRRHCREELERRRQARLTASQENANKVDPVKNN